MLWSRPQPSTQSISLLEYEEEFVRFVSLHPRLVIMHTLNFKHVCSLGSSTAFGNMFTLQSFFLIRRTGFIEKILSIKLPFVLHCTGASR